MIGNIVAAITSSGAAEPGDFESIQTHVVGSGGTSSITFTSIPSTFQHLQIRFISRLSAGDDVILQFNGDTTNNYRSHILYGDGSSAIAGVPFTNAYSGGALYYTSSNTVLAGGVIDVLDYLSTNKNKTMRFLGGWDNNGSGNIDFASALWFKTPEAVTSITIKPVSASFSQHSHFALYGIRG